MAKTVILEFDNDDDADTMVESIQEYNLGILINQDDDTMRKVYPTVRGVYRELTSIEGKVDKD